MEKAGVDVYRGARLRAVSQQQVSHGDQQDCRSKGSVSLIASSLSKLPGRNVSWL
ncbi:MAG TPA: hypothetical protein VGR30_16625 [Candidatus Binatia bacterium]|jgi:hypothetical protein|nr:hypothetical protein [Candidatus Binatia bacterium]